MKNNLYRMNVYLHVMSETVSFEGKGLKLSSLSDTEKIVEEIEGCRNLTTICLSGNSIGVAAAELIGSALKTKNSLRNLLIADIFTSRTRAEIPPAMEFISNGVKLSGCKLEMIDISDNAFGPDGIKACREMFNPQTCSNLKVLKLNNNGLGSMGGEILSDFLNGIYSSNKELSIEVLVCGRNRLEKEGALHISKILDKMTKLKEFNIPQNGIVWQGIEYLANSLNRCINLEVLNFNDNTFTYKGGKALALCLQNLPKIKIIDVGDCLIRSDGIIDIFKTLEKYNHSLVYLNFSYNELKVSDALMIVEVCSKLKDLKFLDLNGNSFSSECINKINNKTVICKLNALQPINIEDCELLSGESESSDKSTNDTSDDEDSGSSRSCKNIESTEQQSNIDSLLNNMKI